MNLVVVGFALAGLPLFIVIALLNMISFSEMGWEFKDFFNDIDELADKAHLLPIPLFVFAGFILARSKAPDRLVRLADAALGALPGGLAIVSIVACTFFTTFTGASGVTIIALGGLLYPVLSAQIPRAIFARITHVVWVTWALILSSASRIHLRRGLRHHIKRAMSPPKVISRRVSTGNTLTLIMCVYAWIRGTQLVRGALLHVRVVAAFKDAILRRSYPCSSWGWSSVATHH